MGDRGTAVAFDDDARQRALDALGILDTPREERFDRVTRLAQELFDVPMVSITFIDRNRQWRKSEIGLGGREAQREDAFCDATIRQPESLIVEDASTDPRFNQNPFVVDDPNLRFYAGHPIEAPGGERVGTLCVMDTQPRILNGRERELLRDLANWVQAEVSRAEEMDRASIVQRSLLPRRAPDLPGYRMAAVNLPAGHLGGDVYDWYAVPGGLRFTVADVMGKGLGAALIAATVRAALRITADRAIEEAMDETTRLLDQDLDRTTTFVTAFHAELEGASGRLRFVDAGHNLTGIMRADGRWERIESAGLPLGLSLPDSKVIGEAVLEPGDAVVCCSDGLIDLLGDDAKQQILEVIRTTDPAGAMEVIHRLAARTDLPDDVTAVMIRREAA